MNVTHDGVARILCVIEDRATRIIVTRFLRDYDMSVSSASNRLEVLRHIRQNRPDLIILDLRRNRVEGLNLLHKILPSSIPVIITDDDQCTANDRVVALEVGADDYITEPTTPREVVARVRAVLRRRRKARLAAPRGPSRAGYRFGGLMLNPRARRLTRSDGTEISLSNREYALLLAFLNNPGKPLTREHLLNATRIHEDIFDRSIDVLVLRLRRKLEGYPRTQRIIETKRGVGYAIEIAVERFG